jgi:hypothetical protein
MDECNCMGDCRNHPMTCTQHRCIDFGRFGRVLAPVNTSGQYKTSKHHALASEDEANIMHLASEDENENRLDIFDLYCYFLINLRRIKVPLRASSSPFHGHCLAGDDRHYGGHLDGYRRRRHCRLWPPGRSQ